KDILIEGEAKAACEITAAIGDDTTHINVEPGPFSLTLPPRQASRGLSLTLAAKSKDHVQNIRLSDIYVGEVWFAGGQSNMEWHLYNTDEYRQNPVVKENSDLRFYTVGRNTVTSPDKLDRGYEWAYMADHGWVGCTEENALYFSAVAYHFAHTLYDALQVPIGIVSCNVGGSSIFSWLPLEDIRQNIGFIWDAYNNAIDGITQEKARAGYHTHLDEIKNTHDISSNIAGLAGELPIVFCHEAGPYNFKLPGIFYNSMLKRISAFPAQGMLWYQGETEGTYEGGQYYMAGLEALTRYMKRSQNNPDFAFNFVQLPPFQDPEMKYWATVCNQMRKFFLRHPEYAMVTTGDVGCVKDIHPPRKRPIGERLAYAAMHRTYDMNHEFTGPIAESALRIGDEIRVSFIHNAGLHQRDTTMGKFQLVFGNGDAAYAKAEIRDSAVYLALPEGPTPKLVRYEFTAPAQIGLYNGHGYPASLFELPVS
ncbi:MAG: sialate O-acetylesterase, partial [Defluviitaleaceae bacterium]|nr:sialate O-acetylesterase [Defluviitaleaceae bacterium]